MATKFVYTDTEIKEIVAAYKAGTSLEVMADKYNKSVASVRMKLVKLGVYVAQAKTGGTKTKAEVSNEFKQAYDMVGPALF